MREFDATIDVLKSLSGMGIRIAVDDFGAGHSILSYLRRFPVSHLKLDRTLVHEVAEDEKAEAIVRSVIQMAHGLDLSVVAEGVENAKQLKFLQAHCCTEGQGLFFIKPVDASECEALISMGRRHWAWQLATPAQRAFQ